MLVKSESEEPDLSTFAFFNLPSTPFVCGSLGARKSLRMTVQIMTLALRDPTVRSKVHRTIQLSICHSLGGTKRISAVLTRIHIPPTWVEAFQLR